MSALLMPFRLISSGSAYEEWGVVMPPPRGARKLGGWVSEKGTDRIVRCVTAEI